MRIMPRTEANKRVVHVFEVNQSRHFWPIPIQNAAAKPGMWFEHDLLMRIRAQLDRFSRNGCEGDDASFSPRMAAETNELDTQLETFDLRCAVKAMGRSRR